MNSTMLQDKQNKKYQKKYKDMEVRIKRLLLVNAALCDEVAKIQESILMVKDERKFLLLKLIEYENSHELSQGYYKHDPASTNGQRSKLKKRQSFEDNSKNKPTALQN